MEPYVFQDLLREGIILKRKSQFTLMVEYRGEILSCRCPTTGRIGNLEITGRPCLIRRTEGRGRSGHGEGQWTVEAISLQRPEDEDKTWIGIDQQVAPEVTAHFIRTGAMPELGIHPGEIRIAPGRGQRFAMITAGGDRIEVRTPLQELEVEIPEYVAVKHVLPTTSMISDLRHISDLTQGLPEDRKAVILHCFFYDHPGYRLIGTSLPDEDERRIVGISISKRVEIWQANFTVAPGKIELAKYFPIAVRA